MAALLSTTPPGILSPSPLSLLALLSQGPWLPLTAWPSPARYLLALHTIYLPLSACHFPTSGIDMVSQWALSQPDAHIESHLSLPIPVLR